MEVAASTCSFWPSYVQFGRLCCRRHISRVLERGTENRAWKTSVAPSSTSSILTIAGKICRRPPAKMDLWTKRKTWHGEILHSFLSSSTDRIAIFQDSSPHTHLHGILFFDHCGHSDTKPIFWDTIFYYNTVRSWSPLNRFPSISRWQDR